MGSPPGEFSRAWTVGDSPLGSQATIKASDLMSAYDALGPVPGIHVWDFPESSGEPRSEGSCFISILQTTEPKTRRV